MEDVFSVELHPCATIEDYTSGKNGYKPLFTHHFFDPECKPCSISWVKYDIYYIVDTFEIFIKVNGQLVVPLNREKVQNSLSILYSSVFKKIPEHTLIKDEQTFMDILLHRTSGMHKFIPPGRIIMEKTIDNCSMFQLRYCTFKDGLENSGINTNEQNSDSMKVRHTLPTHIYFHDSCKSDEVELLKERIEELYKDGKFDSSIIQEILKRKSSLKPEVKSFTIDSYETDYSIIDNFKVLHRRIEWFYHWFIDGASDITYDPRWSIFIPLILTTNQCISVPSKIDPLYNTLTSNDYPPNKEKVDGYDIRTEIVKRRIGSISTFNIEDGQVRYKISIIGMVTCYSYFTINRDRLRISQFMITPNYSGKGFGLMTLELIYRMALLDRNVREVSVEDPTSTFSALRFIVILKMCFDLALISPDLLYSDQEEPVYVSAKEQIVKRCKESKYNASRIVEILQLGVILNPISTALLYTLTKTTPVIPSDHVLKLLNGSEAYVNYATNLKTRIRSEEIRRLGKADNFNLGTYSINAVNHVGYF